MKGKFSYEVTWKEKYSKATPKQIIELEKTYYDIPDGVK